MTDDFDLYLDRENMGQEIARVRDQARDALRSLVVEACERVVTSTETLTEYSGRTAEFDTERDRPLAVLSGFTRALQALQQLPEFARAFGAGYGEPRCSLSTNTSRGLTGSLFTSQRSPTFEAFTSELDDPNWRFVAFANLRDFSSEDPLIDFGDGISIRHRSLDEIEGRLRWTDWHLDYLRRDWSEGHATSQHVVWVESTLEKAPDAAVLSDSATGPGRMQDLLLALWLFAPGDLSIGTIFTSPAAKFHIRGRGLVRVPSMPGDIWGRTYQLAANQAADVRAIYDDVVAFRQATAVPSNVRLAVRRFESVYSRGIRQRA